MYMNIDSHSLYRSKYRLVVVMKCLSSSNHPVLVLENMWPMSPLLVTRYAQVQKCT